MKKKLLFTVSLLIGLLMINGGLNKFFNYIPTPPDMPEAMQKDFAAMMEIEWLMPLLATAELVGGILLIFPKTRALAAVMLFPILAGILLTHIVVEPSGLPIAAALALGLGWIIFENKHKYLPMLKA
jgi:uncharacterized membrane protein YphA (DoxX/SURF4 family)